MIIYWPDVGSYPPSNVHDRLNILKPFHVLVIDRLIDPCYTQSRGKIDQAK
jgi:hypothetical protein